MEWDKSSKDEDRHGTEQNVDVGGQRCFSNISNSGLKPMPSTTREHHVHRVTLATRTDRASFLWRSWCSHGLELRAHLDQPFWNCGGHQYRYKIAPPLRRPDAGEPVVFHEGFSPREEASRGLLCADSGPDPSGNRGFPVSVPSPALANAWLTAMVLAKGAGVFWHGIIRGVGGPLLVMVVARYKGLLS